jgi:hypothetical protein
MTQPAASAYQRDGLKESKKREHIFRDFAGINTQAYRTSIKDNEFAWLENVIPIGPGNLKAVPTLTAQLATISPDVANYMKSANIGGTDYVFMFCNSGAAYQINSTTYAKTTIGAAGTFSSSGIQFDQWKNERIVIVDPNKGLFSWDGSTLTALNGQVQSVTMITYGYNYFHRPTVVFTPVSGGSGAAGTAIIGIGTAAIAAAGTGYVAGDVITLSGGSFNTAGKITVTTVGGSGAVTGISVFSQGDYTAAPSSPVATTGGFGAGCTLTIQWSVISVTVTNGGSGYNSAPNISFTPTGGDAPTVVAAATSAVSVAPSAGTSIAVYSGRAWVANGRTMSFSAPNTYNDFTTANSGGTFIVSDSTLHNNIVQLISANNYLYIFGDDSINVVSDVRVSAGITIFSNTNLTAFIGSSYPIAVQPYLRGVFFMNQSGFYLIYGAVPQKVSDAMDGIISSIDFSKPVTAGAVNIYNQLCMAFYFTYTGGTTPRKMFGIFFNNKWYLASQGDNNTLCCPVFEDGKQELYVTDGTNLFHAFKNTTGNINTTVKTRLWDFGSSLTTKQALKAGFEVVVPSNPFSATVTVDTETSSNTFNFNSQNLVNWTNNSGTVLSWINNLSQVVGWLSSGFTYIVQDVTNYGKYLGLTLTSTTPGYEMNATMLEFEDRARW